MAELDPRNPLSAIGLSNNPIGKESALSSIENKNRMQSALAQIASRGQNADRLAGINNASLEKRTGMPLGLDPTGNTPKYVSGLEQIARNASAQSQAQTKKAIADAHQARASALGTIRQEVGGIPRWKPGMTLEGLIAPENTTTLGTPGKTEASAATVAKLASTDKRSRKETSVKYVPGKGLFNVVDGREVVQVGTTKGPMVAERVAVLHDRVSKSLAKQGRTIVNPEDLEILSESDTHVAVKIKGELKIIKKT